MSEYTGEALNAHRECLRIIDQIPADPRAYAGRLANACRRHRFDLGQDSRPCQHPIQNMSRIGYSTRASRSKGR